MFYSESSISDSISLIVKVSGFLVPSFRDEIATFFFFLYIEAASRNMYDIMKNSDDLCWTTWKVSTFFYQVPSNLGFLLGKDIPQAMYRLDLCNLLISDYSHTKIINKSSYP